MHHTDQLTRQECQVVLALLSGASNRELAEQLLVSVKTIETHLTRIYRKLGYRSRSQVIAAYYTGALDSFGDDSVDRVDRVAVAVRSEHRVPSSVPVGGSTTGFDDEFLAVGDADLLEDA